jgi:ABC-type multidrug transport system ATPase subunit
MHRELNVWENILFSAEVRLPSTWTRSERLQHAEAVLHALQLAEVKFTRIGDETDRGVSGGQRKRVNIGMELAAAPLALFLDEPTSGLDSTNAKDVCATLQNIAKQTGITVVMVIHQPRQEIWYSLSNVLLLAPGGRTVYQGAQSLCEKYFKEHLNVKFHPLDNPADVIMDAIAARGSEFAMTWRNTGATFYWDMNSQKQQVREVNEDGSPSARLPPTRPRKPTFLRSNPSEKGLEVMRQELQSNASSSSSTSVIHETVVIGEEVNDPHTGKDAALISSDSKTRGAPWWMQILLAFLRSIRQQAVGFLSLVFENVLAGASGFIIGLAADGVYSGRWLPPYTLVSPAPNDALIAERGMYIHVTLGLAAASAGVRTFGEDRVQYWREAASGHNRLSYFVGVSLAALPRIFLASLHFTAIFAVMSLPYMPFHEMLGIIFLVWFTIYGVSCLISMLVSKENAPLIAVVVTLVAGTLCGYANAIPFALQYMSYAR